MDAYPRILAALMANGWTEADIRKLAGENVLRVMRSVEAVAASKRGERPASRPSTAARRNRSGRPQGFQTLMGGAHPALRQSLQCVGRGLTLGG